MAAIVYKPATPGEIPPAAKQSPAFKLFHWYFQCLVPANVTYDVNDFEYYGIATTGDPDWDACLSTARTDRSYTAADMAAVISAGAPLSLSDPRDATAIYMMIFEHLCDWRDTLQNSALNRSIPIEGLFEFNALARLMLTIARRYGYQDGINVKVVRSGRWLEREPEKSPLGRITHNEKVMSEILTIAQQRGLDVKKYALAIKAEEPKESKVGSMWSRR